jgi:hypothetical protein
VVIASRPESAERATSKLEIAASVGALEAFLVQFVAGRAVARFEQHRQRLAAGLAAQVRRAAS